VPNGNGCLVWTGQRDRDGYGTFWLRRRGRRAHRVQYFHHHGSIPEGKIVHHLCCNRACVRIDHLQLSDAGETAPNRVKTHCSQGHPFDRVYGGARYCSVCQAAKRKRLRAKWKEAADAFTGC